jgi:hypothetical protein
MKNNELRSKNDNHKSKWRCVMCSPTTIERKISEKSNTFKCLVQAKKSLQCDVCSQHACRTCLMKILLLVPKQFAKSDPWCCYVQAFLNSTSNNFQENHGHFTGHCCELREPCRNKNNKKRDLGELEQLCPKQKKRNDDDMKLDGSLYLPEFHLLLSSPIGNGGPIDIHGMGKDKNLPGEVHCVINPVLAGILFQQNIAPDGTSASYYTMGNDDNYSISINLPYKLSPVTVSSCVNLRHTCCLKLLTSPRKFNFYST